LSYLPWRRVGSWHCLACGECCRKFTVILTTYEYALLTNLFGQRVVELNSRGDPCLRRVQGVCVFQSSEGLCRLQPLGLKPLACKVWPFKVVEVKNIGEAGEADLFIHGGRAYRVYVHSSCNGIGHGSREELVEAIKEVIEIKRNPHRPQLYSTARVKERGLSLRGLTSTMAYALSARLVA